MPGDISRSSKGPPDDGPYVPSWCYPDNSPKMCSCGHHEGYHNDKGVCLLQHKCRCTGMPLEDMVDHDSVP